MELEAEHKAAEAFFNGTCKSFSENDIDEIVFKKFLLKDLSRKALIA